MQSMGKREEDRNCLTCNKVFSSRNYPGKNTHAKYCSMKCYYADYKSPKFEGNCKTCNNHFVSKYHLSYVKSHPEKSPRFCSQKCMQAWRHVPKVEIACKVCGTKKFINNSDLKYNRGQFCSKKCLGIYRSGERNHNWNNGSTIKNDKLRKSPEYIAWRTTVFIRDGKKCVKCDSKKDIEADHIKPRTFYPELTLDINNGRTLCHECHAKTPNYFNSHMTKEEYEALMI
jgi:hypothetical protein